MDFPIPHLVEPASSSARVRVENLPPQAVLIVLMGLSGVGKTFLISKAIEENLPLGHGLMSDTSEISLYPLKQNGSDVFLIDTPGFDDTNKTDIDVLEGFIGFLRQIDSKGHRISGIIYLHRITDNRISGSARRSFQILMELCGKGFFPHVVLATTMWRRIDGPQGDLRQRELEETFWRDMIDGGAVARKYEDTTQSAREIIDVLLRKAMNCDTMPDLQRESVRENKKLLETGVGHIVYKDIKQRLQQYDRSIERIEKECKELEQEADSGSEHRKGKRDEEIRELRKEQTRLKGQQELLKRLLQGRAADNLSTQSASVGSHSSSQEGGTVPRHESGWRIAESALRGQPEGPDGQRNPVGIGDSSEISSDYARLRLSGKADSGSPFRSTLDNPDHSTRRGRLPAGVAPHVCVIGAGLSGLRCAGGLLLKGCNVTIIEARSRIGGRVCESTEFPCPIDIGPSWISGRGCGPLVDLAGEINIVPHFWNGKCNIFDSLGGPINEEEATSFTKLIRIIMEDAVKYSSKERMKILESASVYDYLVYRSAESFPVSEGSPPESQQKIQLLQQISRMWATHIGSPIEQQSLRFIGMENRRSGEKIFFNSMYKIINNYAKKLVLRDAHIQLSSKVVEIRTPGADGTMDGSVVVKTEDGKEQTFDEVVVTAPIGWLKQNKDSFKPPLALRLAEAIDGITVGRLEKVFIAFRRAFWQGHQNTEAPSPHHQPLKTNNNFPSYTIWVSPTYAPHTNPQQWPQEAYDLTESVSPHSQPTLLFCIYGACSAHLTKLVRGTTRDERDRLLEDFFRPYYSLFPHFRDDRPTAFYITDWQRDEFAGYGSYCGIQVGARDAANDVATLQLGLPGRRLWFAGEHAAPLDSIGSAVGAFRSGEEVATRILEAYGRGAKVVVAEEAGALKDVKMAGGGGDAG